MIKVNSDKKNNLKIDSSIELEKGEWELINLFGKLIAKGTIKKITSSLGVEIKNCVAGTYYLVIYSGEKIIQTPVQIG